MPDCVLEDGRRMVPIGYWERHWTEGLYDPALCRDVKAWSDEASMPMCEKIARYPIEAEVRWWMKTFAGKKGRVGLLVNRLKGGTGELPDAYYTMHDPCPSIHRPEESPAPFTGSREAPPPRSYQETQAFIREMREEPVSKESWRDAAAKDPALYEQLMRMRGKTDENTVEKRAGGRGAQVPFAGVRSVLPAVDAALRQALDAGAGGAEAEGVASLPPGAGERGDGDA